MSRYDLHYNYDDVFIRSIIVGLQNLLDNNIGWYNQIGTAQTNKNLVTIPFYFSTTGSERYLQDKFLNDIVHDPNNEKAESFYNKIPRGILVLNSLTISTADLNSKSIRIQRKIQQEDGTLKTFSSETFFIPLIMEFSVEIFVDNILDQLKCSEVVLNSFYKAKTFAIDLKSVLIHSYAIFPETIDNERLLEFKFDDKKQFSVKFSLDVKTQIPTFTEGSDIFKGNSIHAFEHRTNIVPKDSLIETPYVAHLQAGWTGPIDPTVPTNIEQEIRFIGSTGGTN